MSLASRSSLVLAVSLLAGCDYNNDGTLPLELDAAPSFDARDASSQPSALDGGALPGSMDARVGSDAESADAGLRNESFDTAQRITPGTGGVLQDIEHSEQTSYFVFEASSAGFYELRTAAGNFSPDVSLSLYDGARTLIAQNESGSLFPGDAIDARLVVKLPRAGRYFVVVHDASTPASFFERKSSLPIRYFTLHVRALEPGTPGVTYERSNAPAPIVFAIDEASGYSYTTLLGTLEPGTVDTFLLRGLGDAALIGHLLASGTLGNGATASPGRLRLVSSEQQLLADIDGTPQHLQIFPPITSAAYVLTASAPGVVGSNGFYAVDLVMLPDNPRERDEAGNGQLVGAESVVLQGASRRRGLLLAEVPAGDVDYFRFEAGVGETVLVSCQGEAAGSGVRMLRAQLRDATDQTLVTAVESAAHDLDIEAYNVQTPGPHYLRLSSDHVAVSGEAAPWVRCVLIIATQ